MIPCGNIQKMKVESGGSDLQALQGFLFGLAFGL